MRTHATKPNESLPSGGRIGPNAITQVAAALDGRIGPARARALFEAAGLDAEWRAPPCSLVDEARVVALHRTLWQQLQPAEFRVVMREAGRTTGEYLLANRIPAPAQRLLRALPAMLSGLLLAAAIRRHAWTFAGSGRLHVRGIRQQTFLLEDGPLCRGLEATRPQCDYFAATFERLYRRLVSPALEVIETECAAMGAGACRFEIRRAGTGAGDWDRTRAQS